MIFGNPAKVWEFQNETWNTGVVSFSPKGETRTTTIIATK